VDPDRLEALELAGRAADHVMRRPDVGATFLQVSEHLAVTYTECPEHGPLLAAACLHDGRMLGLGRVADAGDLELALVDLLEPSDAAELVGEYRAARVGP
jgi:hypothetical protein